MPIKANYKFNLIIILLEKDNKGQYSKAAAIKALKLIKLYKYLRRELKFIKEKIKQFYNKIKSIALTFKRGDIIYFLQLNLKIIRLSNKLN